MFVSIIRMFQSKRFSCPSKGPSASVQFTSPINVKIIKETRELQREQHDLDTGEIRTWTETEEYEVFDLTEDTPVRVARTGPIAHAEPGERHEAMLREPRNLAERLDAMLREAMNHYKLEVRQLPVIKCPKLSNSTQNPSLNTNTTSSQLKPTTKPLRSRIPVKIAGSRCRSPRARANSLRV